MDPDVEIECETNCEFLQWQPNHPARHHGTSCFAPLPYDRFALFIEGGRCGPRDACWLQPPRSRPRVTSVSTVSSVSSPGLTGQGTPTDWHSQQLRPSRTSCQRKAGMDAPDDGRAAKSVRSIRSRLPLARPGYSSRWTVPGENAGRQTATYSAPSASGVEYCTHSPA